MRNTIVDLAVSQVGIKEIPQNEVKYNTWYYGRVVNGSQYAWCAVFISWLANQCGIMNTLIPSFSGCGTGVNWFKNRNLWLNVGNRPNKGDIIFFKPTRKGAISSHVGIVIGTTDTSVITVEGNKDNQVKKCQYSLGFSQILGYGTPDYGDTPTPEKKVNVYYQTYDNVKKKYLPIVENDTDFGGNIGNAIGGIRAKLSDGSILRIRAHIKGGKWLSEITTWDDTNNGYSGIKGKNIDGVAIKSDNHKIQYQVHLRDENRWLDYVEGYDINNLITGMAGNLGSVIDAVRIRVV